MRAGGGRQATIATGFSGTGGDEMIHEQVGLTDSCALGWKAYAHCACGKFFTDFGGTRERAERRCRDLIGAHIYAERAKAFTASTTETSTNPESG